MEETIDIEKSIAGSRSVMGEDGAMREYFLFRSLGFDEEGKERIIYSLFSRRYCPDGSDITPGQGYIHDISTDEDEAREILGMIADNIVEPEQVRDVVEDLLC